MIETPSLLSPCGSYQVDFFPIKELKEGNLKCKENSFLRIGTFEGKTEFREVVSRIEMFREIESKRFRKFKTIRSVKIPQ
tara:strand:+ start:57 stop:296 length:240 start_codon:yes stop_codon:yes gene_type:complete